MSRGCAQWYVKSFDLMMCWGVVMLRCSPACDEELFVDSPDGWVAQELEGANTETRRRAAVDFVRVLSRHFEARMTQVFGQYVQVRQMSVFVTVMVVMIYVD